MIYHIPYTMPNRGYYCFQLQTNQIPRYWPCTSEPLKYSEFIITFMNEETNDGIVVSDFTITNTKVFIKRKVHGKHGC